MKAYLALFVGAAIVSASTAIADDSIPPVVGGHTYVQHMIAAAKAAHPEIASIEVIGVREGTKNSVIFGSTVSAAKVFTPAQSGVKLGGAWSHDRKLYLVREPYVSSTDHPIGTITIAFRRDAARNPARVSALAHSIATQMARHTLSAKNAADPWPYDPAFGPNTYAQTLTERTVARHPDLLVMMIHATPPRGKKNVIIGSNIGRFGKVADEDDARVIDKGETNLEIGGDKDRFETELPLNDAHGTRIGALGLVFNYHDGADKDALHKHGLAIRDEIARQIPSSAALFRRTR